MQKGPQAVTGDGTAQKLYLYGTNSRAMSQTEIPHTFPEATSAQTPPTETGLPIPLGVYPRSNGMNFAIFSRHATRIWLELFSGEKDASPEHRFELDPVRNRTGDIWHIWVADLDPGQLYGYRADGPYEPEKGHRFNPHKLLIDPYATAITHLSNWDFARARGYDPNAAQQDLSFSTADNAATTPKCVITESRTGWERTTPIRHPWSETVIYELHVRGFTKHPSADVEYPGTYRGLIEKIPYLKDLGVTTVELMPVQEFNEHELARVNPHTGEPLRNYWGYNPTAFMAPNGLYSADGATGEQVQEFKDMIGAFHEANIEVILDVVFNHTAEGNELGPTISLRGLDNTIYYLLRENGRFYEDFTGTGNTVKAQHPVVRELILDALRHWVVEMHVDGFRFDLASVLGRDESGTLQPDPPLLDRIAEDPVLRNVKMIAEAWDAAGGYQVGAFHERRWSEWNGQFRDQVRQFWRGDAGMREAFAQRLGGSPDLYRNSGKGAECSVNYVTSHDGFTLNDLVSYATKHNQANGEFNRDGPTESYSANYGIEGPADDPEIQSIRNRQIKNFLLTLFVSRGVPMLLGGDEFRRTQHGNNNAYCQDNEIGWWLWDRVEEHPSIRRFTKELIAFRRATPELHRTEFFTSDTVQWLNRSLDEPEWTNQESRQLACTLGNDTRRRLMIMFNAGAEDVRFSLPDPGENRRWHLKADTGKQAPEDIFVIDREPETESQQMYQVGPRASVILLAKK